MKFTRLRLSGFKSFVEPTELHLEPGLTAIVGPNGCGKSNLFDALRWVMGEARPTSVRGTEMDDVIFAGSAGRPARNMAEVALLIDNSDRTAVAPYHEFDSIEISRRIEREAGSVYRINGRDVRQRDVQIFFADASSGAASTAFVRQGQIGLLVSQKPLARRAILEEAAGISGLHQRRHEAELRLRAAETNMTRVDDMIRELESQVQNLKRQARQAARYRNISGLIRRTEALCMYLRWNAAQAQSDAVRQSLEQAVGLVAECTARAAAAATVQAECAGALPPLRQTEAERGAALHRLIVEREALDAEELRAREQMQQLRARIVQAGQDLAREQALDADAEGALAKLNEESASLAAAAAKADADLSSAEERNIELNDLLTAAERMLERATADLAEWNAKRQSQMRAREVAAALWETSGQQLAEAQMRLDGASASAKEAPDVVASEAQAEAAQRAAMSARTVLAERTERFGAVQSEEIDARAPLEAAERSVQSLSAEAKALADLLRPEAPDLWPHLIDSIRVHPGYEAALAAALGDDLEAPLDEASPRHWRNIGPLRSFQSLPGSARPLSEFVDAPPALARRLGMTGLVTPEEGSALQAFLMPGQRLVSQRGDLWRWDGYSASADAPTGAAVRLAQRNRLEMLDRRIDEARQERAAAFERFSLARQASDTARAEMREAEQETRLAEQAALTAQEIAAKTARAAAERIAQLAAFEAEIRRLAAARDAALEAQQTAEHALSELGDGVNLQDAFAEARERATEARSTHAQGRAALETLKREHHNRQRRIAAVAEESSRWQSRRDAATSQIEELNRRQEIMGQELVTLEAIPEAITVKRRALLSAIGEAEAARNQAADARTQAESRLAEADKEAKTADATLAAAREERARLEALDSSAKDRLTELSVRIRDELDARPDELAERAEIKSNQEMPSLEQAEKRGEKLRQEREQLGGVNLRAEEEAAEHGQRLEKLSSERNDLDGAIQRLRRGIQNLNREGRERLVEAFEKVNANFQLLFTKLFEGGEARLTLTESEDPLEAGLEIFARPPGKRLQSLSLLSGGEQALTALSLIFAVFLVNPAPVCVLDEVDAPLDEANIGRLTRLLTEMSIDTQFIVITHSKKTMESAQAMYGVTMQEAGVSKLVSVKFHQAERAADAAA